MLFRLTIGNASLSKMTFSVVLKHCTSHYKHSRLFETSIVKKFYATIIIGGYCDSHTKQTLVNISVVKCRVSYNTARATYS